MFSFDKLALLIISLICLGCAMYLAQITNPTAGQATLIGGLVAFLTGSQMIFFSILKAEAKAVQAPGVAPPQTTITAPSVVVPALEQVPAP